MEGIIAIIFIVFVLSKLSENTKKVKQNAPGRTAPPMQTPSAPARPASQPRPLAQPTVAPTVKPAQPSGSFWEQMMDALEELEEKTSEENMQPLSGQSSLPKQKKTAPRSSSPDAGHSAVGSLSEGSSRECEHGSLGGSMAYEHSDGMPSVQRRASTQSEPTEEAVYRPAMTAEEMRRAVVMAEILKRPEERMAEQARRWNLR